MSCSTSLFACIVATTLCAGAFGASVQLQSPGGDCMPPQECLSAPFAKFKDGMLSHTTPGGWLGDWCRRQRNGLTGHPEALSYPYDTCLWVGEIKRMGEHGGGWWRY